MSVKSNLTAIRMPMIAVEIAIDEPCRGFMGTAETMTQRRPVTRIMLTRQNRLHSRSIRIDYKHAGSRELAIRLCPVRILRVPPPLQLRAQGRIGRAQ